MSEISVTMQDFKIKPGQSLLLSVFITIVIMDLFHSKLVKKNIISYWGLGFLVGRVWKLPELLAILKFKGQSQELFI